MVTGRLALNKVARSKALAGVLEPNNIPAQTTLHILDEGEDVSFTRTSCLHYLWQARWRRTSTSS